MRAPPYEVRRLGWGTFTIEAEIVLKEPYNWVIDNAGSRQPGLELTWTLDFEGRGRQGRVRAKVQKTGQPATEGVASTGQGRRTRSTRQAATSASASVPNNGDHDDDEDEDDDYEEADSDSEESQDEEEDISEFIATPRR
jgi:hypothetical protein